MRNSMLEFDCWFNYSYMYYPTTRIFGQSALTLLVNFRKQHILFGDSRQNAVRFSKEEHHY